jgi:hypothetical protein
MIKFFRRIRQQLVAENKFSKYLIYAVGEIVLVVIGILIALGINNWNQAQQNKKLTNIYVNNFIREIKIDIITIGEMILSNENRIKNIDSIMTTLSTKNEIYKNELMSFYTQNESLAYDSYFIPDKTTFRQLESNSNTNVIPSKSLRDNLFQYYVLNDRNEKNGEISTQLYQHNFLTKDILRNVLAGDILKQIYGSTLNRTYLDLEKLRQNTDYIFSLISKKTIMQGQNFQYQKIKVKAENLLVLLESNSVN